MQVKEAMNKGVKIIAPGATVREAAQIMSKYRIGSLVVVEGSGKIAGLITERDILDDVVAAGKRSDDVKVEDAMTKDLVTISEDATLEDAAALMSKNKIKKLPVVKEGGLVGIITASDLIAYEEKLIESLASLLVSHPGSMVGG